MGTTRNIFQWVFENIAPGEVNPEKRVDADRVMDNFRDLRDAVAGVEARGANAEDGNSRGLSTASQCNLTLKTANGQTGLLDLGDAVQIRGGSAKWYLENTLANDELSFSDAELAEGEGPADYADPAFIASLVMDIAKFRPKVGKGELILTGDHADKLTGDDLETGAADPTPLGGKLVALEDRVATSLDESGALRAEAVDNDKLARAVFLGEDFQNVIWGQFDADFDNDGLANQWLKFNTPACELDDAVRKIGARSQKVVASQPQDGICTYPFPPVSHADFPGDYVSFTAWVYAAVADSVVLEVFDGVKTTTAAPGGVAGAWVRLGVEHQVDGAAFTLVFRVYANQAATFHVDGAMAKRGRLRHAYAANAVELMRTFMMGEDYANAVLNGDFAEWTNGDGELPDFWRTGGDLDPPTAVARETAIYLFGASALRLTLGLGEGVFHDVAEYREYASQDVYVSAFFRGAAGSSRVRLVIDDGVAAEYTDFTPAAGVWQRPGRPFRVDANATRLRVSIVNADAGAPEFICDGVMLVRGQFPIAFRRASLPRPFRWDFARPGAVASGLMYHEGANLDVFAVPADCVVHKILAYEGTAPGDGPDTFTVTRDGVATGLAAEVQTGAHAGMAHAPVVFAKGERLQVSAAPGASPGSNAGVVVEGYRVGY